MMLYKIYYLLCILKIKSKINYNLIIYLCLAVMCFILWFFDLFLKLNDGGRYFPDLVEMTITFNKNLILHSQLHSNSTTNPLKFLSGFNWKIKSSRRLKVFSIVLVL